MFCDHPVPQGTRYCPRCGAETGDGSIAPGEGNIVAAPENLLDEEFHDSSGTSPTGSGPSSLADVKTSGNDFFIPSKCLSDPAKLPMIRGWNWGAFLFSWIWAIGHGLIGIALLTFFFSSPPFGLIAMVLLGLYGNELAWKARYYRSVEEFRAQQDKWTKGAFLLMFFFIGMIFLIAIIGSFS